MPCMDDLRDMGVKLVVKHTFLQVEAEQTPSAGGPLSRRYRALSEPCMDRDWTDSATDEEATDEDVETICSEAIEAQSPINGAIDGRPLDEAVAERGTSDFLTSLRTNLFMPVKSLGCPSGASAKLDEERNRGRHPPPMLHAAAAAAPDCAQNSMFFMTPAHACVLLFGMPLQNTCASAPTQHHNLDSASFFSAASSSPAPVIECDLGVSPEQENVRLEERTTLMLKNIPNDYSRAMLLELLDSHGFAGRYDFVYLPIDFKRVAGLGYAFINCVSAADAVAMKQQLHGFRRWRVASQKVCEVRWGEPLQGLEAHIERYRNSPVLHHTVPDEYKPVIFLDGVRSHFPEPTKRIRMPPVKGGALAF